MAAEQRYGDWFAYAPVKRLRRGFGRRRTAPESPRHWASDVPATGGWVSYEFHGSLADLEQWAAQRGVPAEQAKDEWVETIDRIARRCTDIILEEGMLPSVGIMSSAGW